MFKRAVGLVLCAGILSGCVPGGESGRAPALPPVSGEQNLSAEQSLAVAYVGPITITRQQLQAPLMEAYGLNVLLNLVQLELVKQQAAKDAVAVTAEDIRQERQQTLAGMFKEANQALQEKLDKALKNNQPDEAQRLRQEMAGGNEQALEQLLKRENISRPEFDLVMQTNTYLRKLAEPMIANKISEENLREAFRTLYGETVQIRHIQCSNLQEIAEARRRIAGGESFAAVAKSLSRNLRTAPLGGELPPFSRETTGLPQAFKDAAFALKVGEISDPVQAEGAYHLLQLERRIAPKAVKFEDYKDSVHQYLTERLLTATIKDLRNQMAQKALTDLKIQDPVLKLQFQKRMQQQQSDVRDRDQVRADLERQRQDSAASAPATAAATQTAASAATTTLPATTPAAK